MPVRVRLPAQTNKERIMARFTVVLPDSVAKWVKESAKKENVSQSAFVANMLTYAVAGLSRDIKTLETEEVHD